MNGAFSDLRIVDLTDARGLLAANILAKLGADVIQVEPRSGSEARRQPPFDPGLPAGQHSFFWSAFAAGKRSVMLDLDSPEGVQQLQQLIASADVLIESADPAQRQQWQITPSQTHALNPRLIHVSITAFGIDGPKADWAASDLTVWAAAGTLLPSRDNSGVPLRMSVPQSFLNAAADAAGACLIAWFARLQTGLGQHVDIAAQQSASICTLGVSLAAAVGHPDFVIPGAAPKPVPGQKKNLDLSGSGTRTRRSKWQVKDGLVEMHIGLGPAGGGFANNLFQWLHSEGACPDDIASWDWKTLPARIEADEISDDDLERARDCVAAFFAGFTKQQLLEQAIQRRLLCAPIATTEDLLNSPQLASRNFFVELIETGDIKRTLPGAFCQGLDTAFVTLRPAPQLGEHTQEVLTEWASPVARKPESAANRPDTHHAFSADNASANNGRPTNTDSPTNSTSAAPAPLAGLRVLDLAWVVAGPLIGRNLADYGADVIRVESSKRIETARMMGPFPQGKLDPQKSALFENCNAGKRGLTLDLSTQAGRDIIIALVEQWADVVIESFSPGQMRSWGLDYATLKQRKPGLIMLSTSLMGQTGPWSQFAGYGNVGAAVSGFQAIVGHPGQLPVGPFGPYTDFVGPRFGLVALLAALQKRRISGEGSWVDVSQAEAGLQFLAPQLACTAATGELIKPIGNRDPSMAPHGVFHCKAEDAADDSWIAIAIRNDREWQQFAMLVGGKALMEDPRFQHLDDRQEHEDTLETFLQVWARQHRADELEAKLQALSIAAHQVASPEAMLEDPQLQFRHHYQTLPHALMGTTTVENNRFYLSATPARIQRPAPHFQRDNHEILQSLLGYSDAQIASLAEAGVLS